MNPRHLKYAAALAGIAFLAAAVIFIWTFEDDWIWGAVAILGILCGGVAEIGKREEARRAKA